MNAVARPRIVVFEHRDPVTPGTEGIAGRLGAFGESAAAAALEHPGPHEAVLPALETVEVNLVTDAAIAEIHGRFLGDPTATDVITFPHGEVFISVDTAQRCGRKFGHGTAREAGLYLVHALLHLNGHEDACPGEASVMAERQGEILDRLWPTAH